MRWTDPRLVQQIRLERSRRIRWTPADRPPYPTPGWDSPPYAQIISHAAVILADDRHRRHRSGWHITLGGAHEL